MKKKLKHQPRIKGIKRIPKVGSFHPDVQYGLTDIAKSEGKSYSWVIARIVSDFFGIDCETGKVFRKLRLVKRA